MFRLAWAAFYHTPFSYSMPNIIQLLWLLLKATAYNLVWAYEEKNNHLIFVLLLFPGGFIPVIHTHLSPVLAHFQVGVHFHSFRLLGITDYVKQRRPYKKLLIFQFTCNRKFTWKYGKVVMKVQKTVVNENSNYKESINASLHVLEWLIQQWGPRKLQYKAKASSESKHSCAAALSRSKSFRILFPGTQLCSAS